MFLCFFEEFGVKNIQGQPQQCGGNGNVDHSKQSDKFGKGFLTWTLRGVPNGLGVGVALSIPKTGSNKNPAGGCSNPRLWMMKSSPRWLLWIWIVFASWNMFRQWPSVRHQKNTLLEFMRSWWFFGGVSLKINGRDSCNRRTEASTVSLRVPLNRTSKKRLVEIEMLDLADETGRVESIEYRKISTLFQDHCSTYLWVAAC